MVSNLSIFLMGLAFFLSVILPFILLIYLFAKKKLRFISVILGALIFLAAQSFFKIPLLELLTKTSWFDTIATSVLLMSLYIGVVAGVFEELLRFLAIKYLIKEKLHWSDGVGFGVGFAAIESILYSGRTYFNDLIYSIIINNGTYEELIVGKVPPETAEQIKMCLINASPSVFLLGGIERLFVMIIQIALSMLIMYALIEKKPIIILYTMALHLIYDTPVLLLGSFNSWLTEVYLLVLAVLACKYIIFDEKYHVVQLDPLAQ